MSTLGIQSVEVPLALGNGRTSLTREALQPYIKSAVASGCHVAGAAVCSKSALVGVILKNDCYVSILEIINKLAGRSQLSMAFANCETANRGNMELSTEQLPMPSFSQQLKIFILRLRTIPPYILAVAVAFLAVALLVLRRLDV